MKKSLINTLNGIGLLVFLVSVGVSIGVAFDDNADLIALALIIGGLIGFAGYILTFMYVHQTKQ